MAKTRKDISPALRNQIHQEYNHRCAICGADRPQIHHIDEDPSNNDPMNLIPLCPNCHLIDQHNPSQPFDPEKLRLFRKYKDPTILFPQFEPLFSRLRYLFMFENLDVKALEENSKELVDFVSALKMGDFYSKRIHGLTTRVKKAYTYSGIASSRDLIFNHEADEYKKKLEGNRDRIISLVVELLRYQEWRL